MHPDLAKIIGKNNKNIGEAIAANLHNPAMKKFLAGNSQAATQIKQNIAYSLHNSKALSGAYSPVTLKFKVKPIKVKTTGPKTTGPKTTPGAGAGATTRNAAKKTVEWIAKNTGRGITKSFQTIKSLLGKMPAAIKWFSDLGWVAKIMLLGGVWFAYDWVRGLFEAGKEEEPLSPEKAMISAFTGALAYNSEGSDIVVSEAQASTFCDEVMADHSSLIRIIMESCVTLQDISMISLQYYGRNNDTELFDTLKAYKDFSNEKAPGLGGLYGELELIVKDMPIISLGGILCYTPEQVRINAEKQGIDPDKDPRVIEGLVQDWSAYPCVLKMYADYDGTVGHKGDLEYVKIEINDRDAYFLPDGSVQLEDSANTKENRLPNLKGSYACIGEEVADVEVGDTDFNESRKLSDILKESRVITEQDVIEFGDVTITIGGQPPSTDDASDTEYNTDGSVKSTKTTTTSSGIKYVITTVTLADVVAGKGVLKKGDMGDSVRAIQTAVNTKVDSKFGPNTEEAVRVYQKRNGLTVTGTITQETAKRIAGTTDVDQGKVNTNVTTKPEVDTKVVKVTTTDANEMDKIVTQLDNTEKVYIEDQIVDLDTQVSRAPTKEACKTLIASARAGMKKGVYLKDLSSLKQCYNSYNFNAWGDGSRKVRKHYGLKGKGNI